ncbi:uncharacterized protein HMPREF1541_01328 [Cyphellophora europaea CBS 101466]|uniref:RING-type domain-containing protein n=1 Tax=Cyphellophora europaea (strain CBS 101466) TaxID=1220924 RepID=W2SGK9_CYPE1|nr:uncharacterized protein HMPREF1541_01328 [Cyphellophora europaea CBS 101466]ETN47138.1 hypothetical protein HMPREF1541_01328 [Cyphellophora europaea CBS 101466]
MWLTSGASKRSRNSPRSKSPQSNTPRAESPSAILTETLRRNPFRSRKDVESKEDARTRSMNKDLHILAGFFPDVQIEVIRELLNRFDGDSRLQICTEQLYRFKGEWAAGRQQNPPRTPGADIPADQLFRAQAYIDATTRILTLEFRSSSKGSISAVLAEVNNSYSKARPILFNIANKTKWAMFTQAIGWKRKRTVEDAPSVLFEKTHPESGPPQLNLSGNAALDAELEELFVKPALRQKADEQEIQDRGLAERLNETEATAAEALFECEVCYNDVPFENVSTCTTAEHNVCLDCVRRTLHEAIYGQGWHQSVSVEHGTLKCLSTSDCDGRIPAFLVQRAILPQPSGPNTWATFEARLFEASVQTTDMSLVRCPFCSYAEAEKPLTHVTARSFRWSLRRPALPAITLILLMELIPAILFLLAPLLLFFPNYFRRLFYTAVAHIAHRNRRTRFTCLNDSCGRSSCLVCFKAWHDPHICHEPLIVSLRTSVEAARTAAVKRVCPRCGTAFVKSSGCNKLTCVCGYSMCYLCRANIGKAGAAGNAEGAEGYRHFCEHFRPNAGRKCTECDKCDLYREEDEDEAVRRAGELAEQEWREREGMVGVKGLEGAVGNLGGPDSWWTRFLRSDWTIQDLANSSIALLVTVEEV